jgi:threonine-phosphate decarboxylase
MKQKLEFPSFSHGGNISAAARSLGIDEREIVDFSANINPLGLHPTLREHFIRNFWRLEHYPDPANKAARDAISGYHGCSYEEVVLGNGAAELFGVLCLALKPTRILAAEPTYSGYAYAAHVAGIPYHSVVLNPLCETDVTALSQTLCRGDLCFFCNPNNPTGRVSSRDQIDELADTCARVGATLVIDESFYDFLPPETAPPSYIDEPWLPSNVIVVRSLTKILALPGLRLGYLRANTSVTTKVLKCRDPWSVNALALEAAKLYPGLDAYRDETRTLIKVENRYLREALSVVAGVQVVSGDVNFLLLSLGAGQTSARLTKELFSQGILVRECTSFAGLGEGYLRIAVRTHADNQLLCEALASIRNL